jgi:hypothetical protein
VKRSPMPPRSSPLRRTEFRRTPLLETGTSGGWGKPAGGVISGGRSSHPRVGGHRLPAVVSKLVEVRSGKLCEIGLVGCWTWAVEKHHRISQKSGGRHGAAATRSDRCSNLLHACLYCHTAVTLHPHLIDARSNGWVLRERDEPTAEPVLYRGELSYLDDAGGVHSFKTAGP